MKFVTALFLLMPVAAFAGVKEFACDYSSYSDLEGVHELESVYEVVFKVDEDAGKSVRLSENGNNEVNVVYFGAEITFLEVTKTGNVESTLIAKNLNSVHTRNTVMMGDISPMQYYGTCVIQ